MKDFIVEQILDGYLITAFPIALIAGLISFLSPCVLPLVPGYISYAAGFSKSRGRVLLGSVLFVFGFSVLFISYGALFGGFSALRATARGPRDWRLILVWLGWGISVALAVADVVAESKEEELENEQYDF